MGLVRTMAYWWVSQNHTFRQEHPGGYLWAPKRDRGDSTPHHWISMTTVAVGDVIFSYVNQSIFALGIAKTPAYDANRPEEFAAAESWQNDGWRIDVTYQDIAPLPLSEFVDDFYPLLSQRHSPLTVARRGTQGYLFALPDVAGHLLLDRLSIVLDWSADEEIERALVKTIPDRTTRRAVIQARVGQGQFRRDLFEYWFGKCTLTGFDIGPLLRASHIKPWCDSNNAERIDPMNGLLLAPGCDAAFDAKLITFEDDGRMLVSPTLNDDHLSALGLRRMARLPVKDDHLPYLALHREAFHRHRTQ